MNPQYVVDVYLEESDQSWLIWRRCDQTMLPLREGTDMKTLGRHVLEALKVKHLQQLGWQGLSNDSVPSALCSADVAVVFRRDGHVVVGTPFGPDGQAPKLVILGDQPGHEALGVAVAAQAISRRV
ncbi:MAG: hypothetical protein QE488_09495 [Acidovorax sp.]|nr:hypothetical protein [Acidovorax sp.]